MQTSLTHEQQCAGSLLLASLVKTMVCHHTDNGPALEIVASDQRSCRHLSPVDCHLSQKSTAKRLLDLKKRLLLFSAVAEHLR